MKPSLIIVLPALLLTLLLADSVAVWLSCSAALDKMGQELALDTRRAVLSHVVSTWTRGLDKFGLYINQVYTAHTQNFTNFTRLNSVKIESVKAIRASSELDSFRSFILQIVKSAPETVPYVSLTLEVTQTYLAIEVEPGNTTHMIFWVRKENVSKIGIHVNIQTNALDGNIVSNSVGVKANYKPTTRPWYISALGNPSILTFSEIYMRSTGKDLQTSPSVYYRGLGVISVHMSLTSLSASLTTAKPSNRSVLHVMERNGALIGSTWSEPVTIEKTVNATTGIETITYVRHSVADIALDPAAVKIISDSGKSIIDCLWIRMGPILDHRLDAGR